MDRYLVSYDEAKKGSLRHRVSEVVAPNIITVYEGIAHENALSQYDGRPQKVNVTVRAIRDLPYYDERVLADTLDKAILHRLRDLDDAPDEFADRRDKLEDAHVAMLDVLDALWGIE